MVFFSRFGRFSLSAILLAAALGGTAALAQDKDAAQAVQPKKAAIDTDPAISGVDAELAGLQLPPPQYLQPDDPWIYRGTDIPRDGKWLMGELPNGVRYAVRNSRVPPGQVSVRVAVDVGSLHEEEGERGFAHLLEHISFRETDLYKSGEVISYFQRLGARFGVDANASTSLTQTTYKLDLPNARPARVDEALSLFAGMVQRPVITADNLASDIAIVLAEAREGGGADRRIIQATREVFFAGQRLADRSPFGEIANVEAATPQGVRAFHTKWYRPENTLVVMVGDGDPQMLASMIEKYFADWTVAGEGPDEPDFGDPIRPEGADPANPVGETRVIVEPGQPRAFTFVTLRKWEQVVDNLEYNRGVMLKTLAASILNRRLESRARAGGNYLFAAVDEDDVGRSSEGTYVSFSPMNEDWQSALRDVRAVIGDALIAAPTQQEIDREVADFKLIFSDMVDQSRNQSTKELADMLVQAVDIRESIAAPDTFQSLFINMQERFTPEILLNSTQQLFTGEVVRALYLAPDPVAGGEASLRAAMLADVEVLADTAEVAEALNFADLPPIGEPAAPVTREQLGVFDIEHLAFANGVKALVWGTSNEPGRVTVRVRFGGGWQSISPQESVYGFLGNGALVASGIGDLNLDALDRLTTGRKLSLNFTINDGVFEFEGETRREDMANQLYLIAAKLSQPRWDVAPFERAKASSMLAYGSFEANPTAVMNRDIDWLLRDQDERMKKPNPEQLRAATPEGFRLLWERLLAQGPIEVAVFGDIDKEEAVLALSRTFGALPAREAVGGPNGEGLTGFTFPAANDEPLVITHTGSADQAAAIIAWPIGAGSAGLTRARKLELLAQVFSNRLLEALREEEGASYSPFVASRWPRDADSGGTIFAIGQLEPGQVDAFYTEARAIAQDLASNGPSADELARVVEPRRQVIERAQTGHNFWLNQLEGGAIDPLVVESLFTLWTDYVDTTPEEIRALAVQYLLTHDGYRVAILPQEPAQPAQTGDLRAGR